MLADAIDELTERVTANPIRWRADTLAQRLGLAASERTALRITTIGAVDITREQRAAARLERKRQRDRVRAERIRREAGAVPRAEYLASARSHGRVRRPP